MLPKQANTKRFVSLTISLSLADSSYHFFSIQKSDPKCFSVFIENISKEISFQPQTSYTSKKNVIHENLRYRRLYVMKIVLEIYYFIFKKMRKKFDQSGPKILY